MMIRNLLVASAVTVILGAGAMFALADPSQREWRFLRQCRFTLETQYGSLSGQRQLTDDGERLNDDRYDWHFKQPFAGGLFLHLSWDGTSSSTPWEGGGVDAYLHDDVELPSGRLTIRRSHGSKAWASLTIAMPQNENRVITGYFRLVDLLAFAKDDKMLEWTYEGQSKPRIVKTGKIDVAILREAARAREAVEHKLTSLEANYSTMCQRVPDYSPRIVI